MHNVSCGQIWDRRLIKKLHVTHLFVNLPQNEYITTLKSGENPFYIIVFGFFKQV